MNEKYILKIKRNVVRVRILNSSVQLDKSRVEKEFTADHLFREYFVPSPLIE